MNCQFEDFRTWRSGLVARRAETADVEWPRVRAVILNALWPFEEARIAVSAALRTMGAMPAEVPTQ